MSDTQPNPTDSPQQLAAIDLGSNSFHMVIAQVAHGEIRVVEKRGEKVQLAAGLNNKKMLDDDSQARGLSCLERFAQKIKGFPADSVQIVGTNTLREAKNSKKFIRQAEKLLGRPIEVINGREEARMIYLGVAHTLADDQGRRLVMDIGGGSTEFIIGERFEATELESLHMGCVSFRERYFADGVITDERFDAAIREAAREIKNIRKRFLQRGWKNAVGSSGSIRAVNSALQQAGFSDDGITGDGMQRLRRRVVEIGQIDGLAELGVKKERQSIFPAGLAILMAAFRELEIDFMACSDGALREGLLYDMLGRIQHEDVRERTIGALLERYQMDREQAGAVERLALTALRQARRGWGLQAPYYMDLLRWASRLHAIGLTISHSQYHKHGAYLVRYSDLPGFTRPVQQALATLVRCHRRKLTSDVFDEYSQEEAEPLLRLCLLLRLAVILEQARDDASLPIFELDVDKREVTLGFEPGWLESHPLTLADLQAEASYVERLGYQLSVN